MGPKKGKKSKAELEEERLAREEEERKAKAAEEKRQAEEREKRRIEEAKHAAELKVLRAQDLERWKTEYEDFVDVLKGKHQQLLAEEKREEERREWLRFKDPSDEIDATLEKDMNTFITLTKEIPCGESMKDTIDVIRRIESLACTVEDVWSDSLANKNYVLQERAYNNLHILRDTILEKLDQATVPLIRFAEKHLNDRVEFNCEETAKDVAIGLWATFNDIRPIRKSVQLESMGIQLDIPKQVLQQHERYIYRVIRLPIVTYNLDSYMRSKGHHVVTLEHNDHHHEHRHEHHHHNHHLARVPTSLGFGANRHHHSDNFRRKSRDESVPFLEQLIAGAQLGAATAEQGGKEAASDAHPEDRPKTVALTAEQQAALNNKYIVGDLIYFDLLYAPAQPFNLRAKKWFIRDNSANSTVIRKATYPSSVACRMFIKVPDHVSLTDDLRIAVWHEEQQDWVEDGITDYQYSEITRIVQFYVTTTGIFALVKRRHVDMPLKKWSLFPVLNKPVNKFMLYRNDESAHSGNVIQNTPAEEQKASMATEQPNSEGSPPSDAPAAASEDPAAVPAPAGSEPAGTNTEGSNTVSDENKDQEAATSANSEAIPSTVVNVAALSAALQNPHSLSDETSTSVSNFEQHARLFLQTNQYEVIIDVIGSDCYLVKPDAPFCRDILNRPMTPGVLLMRLQRKGIQLVPTDHDLSHAKGCFPKRRVLEDEVWRHVSSGCSALEFSGCREWNTTLNDSQIGILVKESCVFACPAEAYDYECVLVERDEVSVSFQKTPSLGFAPGPDRGILYTLVHGNDYGNKKLFSHVPRPNEKAHVEFHATLESRLTPEAVVRTKRINQRFQKTVYTLLSLIKIYSQS